MTLYSLANLSASSYYSISILITALPSFWMFFHIDCRKWKLQPIILMSPNFLSAEVQMATIARVTKNMYNVFKFIYTYMKLLRKVQGMRKLSN